MWTSGTDLIFEMLNCLNILIVNEKKTVFTHINSQRTERVGKRYFSVHYCT